jgi:hypothetical protein
MIGLQNALQTEFKSTQQILVRFSHAPCVKLTLQARPAMAHATHGVRVLRLRKSGGASR